MFAFMQLQPAPMNLQLNVRRKPGEKEKRREDLLLAAAEIIRFDMNL